MKKRLLILLSVLIMCVGLCACGAELTDEQTAAVCGTWYLRAFEEKAENPGYIELKKDGTGSFNGTEALTWSGRMDSGEDAGVTVNVVTETETAYTLSLSNDKTEVWLTGEKDGPEYCYQRADMDTSAAWFDNLMTRWYARKADSPVQTVELKDDGSLMLGDNACFWTKGTDWVDDGNSVHLHLYDERGVFGVLEAYSFENGLFDFVLYDYATHQDYGYDNHSMVNFLEIGSWESFDRQTMIDDCVILGKESRTADIAGGEYAVKFDTAASPETLTVNFLEGDDIRYSALVFMDGQYPMATLTDQQTQQQTLYYNSAFGYDESNQDALYYRTLDLIYRYAGGNGLFTLETGEKLAQDDALPYIYEKLTELGDYRETRELLARFTVVPDKLTGVIQYRTDYRGDIHEIELSRYGYNEKGTLIWGRGEDIIEKYGVNSAEIQYFTYDAKGKIAGVQTGDGQMTGTPIFDGAGKLVGMHVKGQDTEYTTVYTYGTGHRVIRMGVSRSESYYPLVYEYEYDDEGRLITKTVDQGSSFASTGTYTYEDGELTKIVQVCWKNGMSYTNTYYFTNDEQGRPLSAEVATNDPDMDYSDLEIKYIYEDLYFFDTAGLIQEVT